MAVDDGEAIVDEGAEMAGVDTGAAEPDICYDDADAEGLLLLAFDYIIL